jgi:phosphoserine phosphatase
MSVIIRFGQSREVFNKPSRYETDVVKLVVFDMDGVLADIESSWVYVHRHFGVNNDHSLYAYLRGEIDDLEFIRRDIELWMNKDRNVTADSIARILSEVPLMPGAQGTVESLRKRGVRTAIVSAGIDLLAERISRELGMDFQLANGFAVDNSGKLLGDGVLRVRLMDKGSAVVDVTRSAGVAKKDVVCVGNSQYDVSMFRESGRCIAFCPSDDHVRQEADAVVLEKDLTRILDHI